MKKKTFGEMQNLISIKVGIITIIPAAINSFQFNIIIRS